MRTVARLADSHGSAQARAGDRSGARGNHGGLVTGPDPSRGVGRCQGHAPRLPRRGGHGRLTESSTARRSSPRRAVRPTPQHRSRSLTRSLRPPPRPVEPVEPGDPPADAALELAAALVRRRALGRDTLQVYRRAMEQPTRAAREAMLAEHNEQIGSALRRVRRANGRALAATRRRYAVAHPGRARARPPVPVRSRCAPRARGIRAGPGDPPEDEHATGPPQGGAELRPVARASSASSWRPARRWGPARPQPRRPSVASAPALTDRSVRSPRARSGPRGLSLNECMRRCGAAAPLEWRSR